MKREDLKKLKLPDGPGVYFFVGTRGKIFYIGKAASLRDRVRSYFSTDLEAARSPAIASMVEQAKTVKWLTTDSVLEALILESNLIKRHQPPYNVEAKDNKSYNYLVITKEDYPRVLIVRGRQLFAKPLRATSYMLRATFGPFPHGLQFQEAVKIVRKIFPFRDACTPCAQARAADFLSVNSRELTDKGAQTRATKHDLVKENCRPCFNRQIGLCPGVCTGDITRQEYARQIKFICELFSGNFHGLRRRLAAEMKRAAKAEEFERAATLRRQSAALEHVRDVSLIRAESRVASGGGTRVEAFDVAHTSGKETVAVMTVVNNGEMVKAAYRKFKIRSAENDDIAALSEALSRRLAHDEWPLPRLFVVDGGKAQVRAAERILKKSGISIPVAGVVKNEFHKPQRLIGDARTISAFERDILLANSEAHRFGISWHRRRMRRAMK